MSFRRLHYDTVKSPIKKHTAYILLKTGQETVNLFFDLALGRQRQTISVT